MPNGWYSIRIRMDEVNYIHQARREKLSFYTSLRMTRSEEGDREGRLY
ncbi:MAG TPA: hypothetical protein VFQ36_03560 [Ktedonobacteraceae bacterium]|nr:hypothetical protein [Ktedonobacteraceae bacterium]